MVEIIQDIVLQISHVSIFFCNYPNTRQKKFVASLVVWLFGICKNCSGWYGNFFRISCYGIFGVPSVVLLILPKNL